MSVSGRFGTKDSEPGVLGHNDTFQGVSGTSTSDTGVFGASQSGRGVHGNCDPGPGVLGTSKTGSGVTGASTSLQGVSGFSDSDTGVFGQSNTGRGVHGNCDPGPGVLGTSKTGTGVGGNSDSGSGVFATTKSGQGVTTFSDDSIGIFAQGGFWAGVFSGGIVVGKGPQPKTPGVQPNAVNGCIVINDGGSLFLNGGGDVILGSGDCAEDFTVAGTAEPEPGTVMVLGEDQDKLCQSYEAYDKRVVGVISGAGSYKPGLVLDRQPDQKSRVPIALLGKVYCKVDAQYAEIQVGDLLCTSPTPGHAMKAIDPEKAFGAIIGKALRPVLTGCALIPILVALQ